MPTLEEYLAQRLRTIQLRHNFHPSLGARQISNEPGMQNAYGRFDELLRLVQRLELDVQIPHDPAGLDPMAHLERRLVALQHVYFMREKGTSCWKIGHSKDPPKRLGPLQTGNPRDLYLRFFVYGGRTLETAVHAYLKRFKIRGRSKEWFELELATVRKLVRRLREDGEGFLHDRPLQIQK